MDSTPDHPLEFVQVNEVMSVPVNVKVPLVGQPVGISHSNSKLSESQNSYGTPTATQFIVKLVSGTVKLIIPWSPSLNSPSVVPVPSANLKLIPGVGPTLKLPGGNTNVPVI